MVFEGETKFEFDATSMHTGVASHFEIDQSIHGKEILVRSHEYDVNAGSHILLGRDFQDAKAAAAWFDESGHAIPADVSRALRADTKEQNPMTVDSNAPSGARAQDSAFGHTGRLLIDAVQLLATFEGERPGPFSALQCVLENAYHGVDPAYLHSRIGADLISRSGFASPVGNSRTKLLLDAAREGTLSSQVLSEMATVIGMQRDGAVIRAEDIARMAAIGGYAPFARDAENQDICDHLMSIRVISFRNALRDLGWHGERYKTLFKGGAALNLADLDSPTAYNRTNFRVYASVSSPFHSEPHTFAHFNNDMTLSAKVLAARFSDQVNLEHTNVPTIRARCVELARLVRERDPKTAAKIDKSIESADESNFEEPDADDYRAVMESAMAHLPVQLSDDQIDMSAALAQGRVMSLRASEQDEYKYFVLDDVSAARYRSRTQVDGWIVTAEGKLHETCYPRPTQIPRMRCSALVGASAEMLNSVIASTRPQSTPASVLPAQQLTPDVPSLDV